MWGLGTDSPRPLGPRRCHVLQHGKTVALSLLLLPSGKSLVECARELERQQRATVQQKQNATEGSSPEQRGKWEGQSTTDHLAFPLSLVPAEPCCFRFRAMIDCVCTLSSCTFSSFPGRAEGSSERRVKRRFNHSAGERADQGMLLFWPEGPELVGPPTTVPPLPSTARAGTQSSATLGRGCCESVTRPACVVEHTCL